jgi:1,4-dihydroxy-2-naphthoate octaprenyltransferase
MAIRPKTLPVAVAPVITGTAAAAADHVHAFLPAAAALIGALLLQIGVNLANDYFDFKHGIDSAERIGPVRVTQSGLIASGSVLKGILVIFSLATLVGIYLVHIGGIPILAVGILSIGSALAYSGGPYPLASHGLGDLFAFIFFGPMAVCGTYYVQALSLPLTVIYMSVPAGLLIAAILVVNNLRDIDTDKQAGKHTLAVQIGPLWTRIEYLLLLSGAYLLPVLIRAILGSSQWIWLPLLSLPMAISESYRVWRYEGAKLNAALGGTVKLTLIFSILFSIGILMMH